MRLNIITSLLLIFAIQFAYSSEFETVVDLSFKLGPAEEMVKHYAFDEGDIVEFQFTEKKGKGIKYFAFENYNGEAIFSLVKESEFTKQITISNKGFYSIRLINEMGFRIGKLLIKRNNVSESGLSTEINWKEKVDTIWTSRQEKYLDTTIYTPVQVHDKQNFYINSATNIGGQTRVTLPLDLPNNTVEWFYTFSCSREESEIKDASDRINLLGDLTSLLATPVGGEVVQLTANMISKPPGANQCDIYLINDENVTPFLNKYQFSWYPDGTRENYKSGVVQLTDLNLDNLYIGISNEDMMHGIHVVIEVVAITKEDIYKEREVKEYTLKTSTSPTFYN